MSFDSKRIQYSKERIYVVEIDQDYCSNTYGVAPCTASETGDNKCFQTLETCDDIPNYTLTGVTTGEQTISVNSGAKTFTRLSGSFLTDGFVVGHTVTSENMTNSANDQTEILISAVTALVMTFSTASGLVTDTGDGDEIITLNAIKTYRHCTNRSPHPIGLDAVPDLKSVNIEPAVIDISGGLGIRSNVTLTFNDHPSSDIDIDKYLSDRTYNPITRGQFWTKWRARNPNYQFRDLRVLTAYLTDGVYNSEDTQARHFVIDRLNVSNGSSVMVGKDPLKLASSKKALVPIPSLGKLSAALTAVATSATLIPAGIGSEYPSSGFVAVRSETMGFTIAGDVLTLTRGQKNTVATSHSINDTVQLCYVKNAKVDVIVEDLMTNFATIDSSFIPSASWNAETDTYLPGLLDGIITKPTDVWKVLKELSQSAPHYTWWDERTQLIQLTALKAPPPTASVLDMDKNLISKSVRITDNTKMRASTILIHFGQFDPTKKIDELDNYKQTYIRIDTDSITKYKSDQQIVITSRWINNGNKAAAVQLAALVGRRSSNIPRNISFSLEAKDADVWIGQTRSINHRDIPDPTGLPIDTLFQLTSVKESTNYNYTGIEFAYGEFITGDPAEGDTVYIAKAQNVVLKDLYETNFGSIAGQDIVALFIVEAGVVIGSTSTGLDSLDTGSWAAANSFVITLLIEPSGFVVGKGGDGEHESGTPSEEAGGDAINMQDDLEIINNGVIGSGGGGAIHKILVGNGTGRVSGAGGAGSDVGLKGSGNTYTGSGTITTNISATDGTLENGGTEARLSWFAGGEPFDLVGETGGDLGLPGNGPGAAAGIAIRKNGNILTETVTGDIRGTIV